MKIGTLNFVIFGELLFLRSIETFMTSMDRIFLTVSNEFDSDYRRFSFYAAVITIKIPLITFWKNDTLYKTLKKELNNSFQNWTIETTLSIHETGG